MAKATTRKKAKKKGGKRPGAGRPSLPSGEARGIAIAIRVNPREMAELERRSAGRVLSEWARETLLS